MDFGEFVAIRRDLHAHPELAFHETRTAGIVQSKLEALGITTHCGIGGTGVVGVVKMGTAPRAIMLRADMDALPMQERNLFSHRSTNENVMHGCGHDGHTAILLAAAKLIVESAQFDGTVYFVFQPAEENGNAGARTMIQDGLFTRFPADAIYGLHNWPGLPVGEFGLAKGPLMAGGARFAVEIVGKGGHGALPHLSHDPVPAMTALMVGLPSIINRNVRALDSAVLSITQVAAGGASHNVIGDKARLGGTVRAFRPDVFDMIEARMRDMASQTAAAYGCTASISFDRSYPPLVNSTREADMCCHVVSSLGVGRRMRMVDPVMGSEDFAFYLAERPGCYFFLGNGEGEHRVEGHGHGPCLLHNDTYDFNDALIPVGAEFWRALVEAELPRH